MKRCVVGIRRDFPFAVVEAKEIGRRIVEFEQGGEDRATYGQALLPKLSTDLARQFGRGYQCKYAREDWSPTRCGSVSTDALPNRVFSRPDQGSLGI